MTDLEDTIRALEDRRYRAMVAADRAALEALLADTLVYTHSNGATDTKQSYIAGIEGGKWKYRKIERPQETIQVYGACAVVSGLARIEVVSGGVPKTLNSRYVNVWVQGSRGWQMAAWQSTPVAA